uniref:Uncharacterized protein n=1 Tax=Felis catus TaxID=9685 RepID=A0ABI8AFH9_FELCA
MTVCQVKLIMYVSLSPSLSIHCYRFVSYNNVYCIDWTLKNERELVILYTFPTFASPTPCSHVLISIMAMMDYWHLTNMTGCYRSLSRDFQTLFPPELTIIEIVY